MTHLTIGILITVSLLIGVNSQAQSDHDDNYDSPYKYTPKSNDPYQHNNDPYFYENDPYLHQNDPALHDNDPYLYENDPDVLNNWN